LEKFRFAASLASAAIATAAVCTPALASSPGEIKHGLQSESAHSNGLIAQGPWFSWTPNAVQTVVELQVSNKAYLELRRDKIYWFTLSVSGKSTVSRHLYMSKEPEPVTIGSIAFNGLLPHNCPAHTPTVVAVIGLHTKAGLVSRTTVSGLKTCSVSELLAAPNSF
jgi:hypothetical protein